MSVSPIVTIFMSRGHDSLCCCIIVPIAISVVIVVAIPIVLAVDVFHVHNSIFPHCQNESLDNWVRIVSWWDHVDFFVHFSDCLQHFRGRNNVAG